MQDVEPLVLIETAGDPVPVILERPDWYQFEDQVVVRDGKITVISERELWREATDEEYGRYYDHYMENDDPWSNPNV